MIDGKELRTGIVLAIILAIGANVWAFALKLYDNISFSEAWSAIYNTTISIVYFIGSILLVVFLSKVRRKKKITPTPISKSEQIRKFNKITYDDFKILVRWRVVMGAGGIPYVDDIELFCTHHDPPLRFMYGKCIVEGCNNSKKSIDDELVENDIESRVRHEWDLLNEED